MATKLINSYNLVNSYTQAEEDTFAGTLTGRANWSAVIYNSTINVARMWNGTAFETIKNYSNTNLPITYVGTTISGTDNTAMAVKTVELPTNTLTKLGDRIRIRVYFAATEGGSITGNIKINGVTCTTNIINSADIVLAEAWVHYRDATHANIIESGSPLGVNTGINIAGFSWGGTQNITFEQTQTINQHLDLYCLFLDLLPIAIL